MTNEIVKEFFNGPIGMFLLMLLSSFGCAYKQLMVVRQTGTPMTIGTYLAHWPETIGTLLTNAIALVVLLLTDQLNYASAISVGYGVNSAMDLLPGTRSYALKSTPDDPVKMEARRVNQDPPSEPKP